MKRVTDGGETLIGNNQFEGFCVDMLDQIAEMVGFKYEIKVVEDGNYGKIIDEKGTWNGMVGELLNGVSKSYIIFRRDVHSTYQVFG